MISRAPEYKKIHLAAKKLTASCCEIALPAFAIPIPIERIEFGGLCWQIQKTATISSQRSLANSQLPEVKSNFKQP
jgi:hypothetical protein